MNQKRVLLSLFLSGLVSVTGAAFAQGTGASGDAATSGARGGARTRVEEPTTSVQGGNTATDAAATQCNQIGHVSGAIVSSSDSAIEIKTDTGNRIFIVDNRTSEAQGLAPGVVVTIYFDKNANGHDRALRVVTGQTGNAPTGAEGASDLNRPDPRARTGAPTDSIAPTPGTQTTTGTTTNTHDMSGTSGTSGSQTGSPSTNYGTTTGSTTDTAGSSASTDTSTSGSTSGATSGTTGGTLPRTASDMPLVGLIGLGALAAALAVRVGRSA